MAELNAELARLNNELAVMGEERYSLEATRSELTGAKVEVASLRQQLALATSQMTAAEGAHAERVQELTTAARNMGARARELDATYETELKNMKAKLEAAVVAHAADRERMESLHGERVAALISQVENVEASHSNAVQQTQYMGQQLRGVQVRSVQAKGIVVRLFPALIPHTPPSPFLLPALSRRTQSA